MVLILSCTTKRCSFTAEIIRKRRDSNDKNQLALTNFFFPSDEGSTLETLDFTIRIGSTPTFLYFDLYLNTAYVSHYVYFTNFSAGSTQSRIIKILVGSEKRQIN